MKCSPLKRKHAKPRRSSRVEDSAYRARVRMLPCLAIAFDHSCTCWGEMHAHHMREAATAGKGQKPDDSFCTPLCMTHHTDWHANAGVFKGMDRSARLGFAVAAVQKTREILGWYDKEKQE